MTKPKDSTTIKKFENFEGKEGDLLLPTMREASDNAKDAIVVVSGRKALYLDMYSDKPDKHQQPTKPTENQPTKNKTKTTTKNQSGNTHASNPTYK